MWKTAYLETRVLSASPVELINILYEYAILSVQDARDSLARGDIAARAKSIAKAIAILGELDSSLDRGAGGEIAVNLGKLYQYMRERLSLANLKQADEPLAEVEKLLQTLARLGSRSAGTRFRLPMSLLAEMGPRIGAHFRPWPLYRITECIAGALSQLQANWRAFAGL